MPNIQVSQQTYQRIESRARPFEDTKPEDVIRRLLDDTEGAESQSSKGAKSADLVSRGGRLPHGSKLRMKYKGAEYHAVVDDGKIVWNGQNYSSPSKAAVAVIRSTGSDRTTADGWRHWEVKTPASGEWRLADDVRNGSRGEKKTNGAIKSIDHLSGEEKKDLIKILKDEMDSKGS
jgi:hypothetical protein